MCWYRGKGSCTIHPRTRTRTRVVAALLAAMWWSGVHAATCQAADAPSPATPPAPCWTCGAGARLVDVRDRAEYSRLHIPGAENLPLQSLPNARGSSLVVYDGGRLRADALVLCERLHRYGLRDFKVIDGGIAAWAQSQRRTEALDASRLTDVEVAAALAAGQDRVVAHSDGLSAILKKHAIAAGGTSKNGRTIVLGHGDLPRDRLLATLSRRSGGNIALYWTGAPEQLDAAIARHKAQESRRLDGPMVDYRCPGL
ncbi:hypothetical protein CSC68_04435 [Pseudoxanthomonas suwonensis]|nr:hypothetical protein CSC68_04435 [Pseudoxanthomonas suwonensis]